MTGLRPFEGNLGGIEIEVGDLSQAHDLADFLRGLCFDVDLVGDPPLDTRTEQEDVQRFAAFPMDGIQVVFEFAADRQPPVAHLDRKRL